MNTIKYSYIFDEKTETHDIEFYKKITLKINEKDYIIDNHASLMIYPTIFCNGNCSFCMNKHDNNFKKMIDCSKNDFLNKLKNIFILFKDIKPSIVICGGEPTISENAIEIMRLAHEFNFPVRSFPTNGVNLLKRINGKTFLQYMYEFGFNKNINLSIQHFNAEKNKNIMGFNISENDVKSIGMFCKINNLDLRTSAILLKNGICCLDNIESYLNYFEKFQIPSFIFRELMKIKDGNYLHNNFIDINNIIEEIKENNNYIFIRKMIGAYYNVMTYRFKNYLVKIYKEKFNKDQEYIRDFIFGSDGHLYISNVNKENTLIF